MLSHWTRHESGRRGLSATAWITSLLGAAVLITFARALPAQTDYYNTDAGRPIRTEDAYPVERRALELQIAPLRLERAHGGTYSWGIEPEVAVGLLPRTQFEIGVPLLYTDRGAGRSDAGLAGVELAVLHNLNVETSIPAFALAAEALLPIGALAPDKAYYSVKAIATRTYTWARFHVNGQYTFGDDAAGTGIAHAGELSRWSGGLAIDRTFPLRSLLLTAEIVAQQPLSEQADLAWDAAGGARFQLSPRVALDGGAGYRLTGDPGWFMTLGAAVAVGLPWRGR